MRLYERYQVKRGDNLGDPTFWNRRFEDIDNRMHARELDGDRIDAAVDDLTAVGLQRLNDTFTPVIQQAIAQLESVGARFEAESLTENEIGLGEMTFVVTPETRASWVVTDYIAAFAFDDPDNGIVASVTSYDRTTGILVVDVVAAVGEGIFDAWKFRVSAPPDLEHATRTDNPHLTTAAQVGAYTIAQTDAAIAAALAGYVPPEHAHEIADVTGLQTALDDKATNAAVAAKLDSSAYTAADVLAKLLTVDGSGSGLDADKWKGASYTVSTATPSGGADGDFWFERET